MKNEAIVVGLASFGMSGSVFHAPFIEKNLNFRLKLILERDKNLSREDYPKAKIVSSFSEILKDKEVELVIVNTPTYLHYEMTKLALLAGKHVVVEKPFTTTSKEGEELIQISRSKNLLLSVYHNKRLEGDFKTIKSLLKENRLGTLINFQIALHRYKPEIGAKKWKENNFSGAGLLYDIGSHLIDQCLQLFGWPLDVNADLQIQRKDGKVIDYFCITLKYKGFNAIILSDMLTKEHKATYTIVGTKASFVKYGKDPQEMRLSKGKVDWDILGEDIEENHGTLTLIDTRNSKIIKTQDGYYMEFYQNIFEALRKGAPLLVTPEQALDVIKVIEWVQKSPITFRSSN